MLDEMRQLSLQYLAQIKVLPRCVRCDVYEAVRIMSVE